MQNKDIYFSTGKAEHESLCVNQERAKETSRGTGARKPERNRRHTEGRDPAPAAVGSMADRGPEWAPAARSGRYARRRRWPEGSAATSGKNCIKGGR